VYATLPTRPGPRGGRAGGARPDYPGKVFLGIDTSLGTAVALVEADGFHVAAAHSDDPRGHAEVIGDLIARVVDAAGTITHVAAGMGPGPFTGLRVGIAAARAFALGRGIPLTPVVSHDAIALGMLTNAAIAGADESGRFAVVTDARRREFAFTVYDGIDDDGLPRRANEPALALRDELDARLDELGAERRDAVAVDAAMLALVAARATASGRSVGPAEPLYLRAPDVSPPKRVRL
jgi:tRNA threonylcarbamoyladenosine biosynthesis protein TsaB